VLHGNRTYLLQDGDGQIKDGHSISAGLDYPGIGPEHSWLKESAGSNMSDHGQGGAGSLPALHEARRHHPGAGAEPRARRGDQAAPKMGKDQIIVMNLCGRGDKDVFTVGKILGVDM
jgi:tryptophan synthase beta chain